MKLTTWIGLALAFPFAGCAAPSGTSSASPSGAIPEAVRAEVQAMAEDDQRWEHLVLNGDPAIREPGFFQEKAALQDERGARCEVLFEEFGMFTPARVGEDLASDFWVLVQHADRDPEFQGAVLAAIVELPTGTFDPMEQAYLVDRVRVNTGRGQLYGTQTTYDLETSRAYPKTLEDPGGVDERRGALGLEPLWSYMNGMSEVNFTMNRAMYEAKGILKPWAYADGFTDWE